MNEVIVLSVLVAIAVYALAYSFLVLRGLWANRNQKFGDLLVPQFKKLFEEKNATADQPKS